MSRITVGRSPGKNQVRTHFPISKFLPILEDYADIWDIDIVACWPLKGFPAPSDNKEKAVAVNFFHDKVEFAEHLPLYSLKSSVLGHVFEQEIYCISKSLFKGSERHEFFDFDDSLLAHIDDQSINFDFDFLRACWDGHEDVLGIVLAWGLAQLSRHKNSLDQRNRFEEYVRKQCADRKTEGRSKFSAFQQQITERSIEHYERKLVAAVASSVEYEAVCVEAHRQVEELIALDLDSIDDVQVGQFERDFDRLRNLRGIARVEVLNSKVSIITRRLEQIYPPPSEVTLSSGVARPFDVGSIEFTIDPASDSVNGITFEAHEQGAYRNQYLIGEHVCLGSQMVNGGMNFTVQKLLVKCRIADIAALVLTFFRFVNAPPVKVLTNAGIKTSTLNEYTNEDWEREKQAYVALLSCVAEKKGKKEREIVLQKLIDKRSNAFEIVKKCWEAAVELEHVRRHINARRQTSEARALVVLDKLEKHPAVLGFYMQCGLRIWFNQQSVFSYPTLLWIGEDGVVRLITLLESFAEAKNHAILWNWKGRGDAEPIEHITQGEYADLVSCVKNVVRFWYDQARAYEG